MGANNSTRRVSFESDENENITVVKGIRVSYRVDLLKETGVTYLIHSPSQAVEPLPSHVPKSESLSSPPIFKPITILPASLLPSGDSLPRQSADSLPTAPLPEFTASCEPVAPPPQPTAEPLSPASALRKKITDELYKDLAQKRIKTEQDMQAWYDAEKARASAQAQADVQSKVQEEISRILSVERALTQDSLQQAIIRERISSEDEKLRAQLLVSAKQLEAKEADLKKQDAFYREQVARLEERSEQFYKVTKENYNKAVDQVNAKFNSCNFRNYSKIKGTLINMSISISKSLKCLLHLSI
uniref:Coiled-coil-helix-coiled-coil-helix domain containing 3a n=1 Tax=Xiphophorus couchianus TaxID=32473 RepID=A0A3B5M3Q8_9TELE